MADAIDKAVNLCIEEGILADFLIKHRSEVVNVLLTEYDFDAHMEATYEEGKIDGIAIGEIRGESRGVVKGETKERAYGIKALIVTDKKHCISREDTRQDLMQVYSLKENEADTYLDLHWDRI